MSNSIQSVGGRKRVYPRVSCITSDAVSKYQSVNHFDVKVSGLDYGEGCFIGTKAFLELLADIGRESNLGVMFSVSKAACQHIRSDDLAMRGAAIGFMSTMDEFLHFAVDRLGVREFAEARMADYERARRADLKETLEHNAEFLAELVG